MRVGRSCGCGRRLLKFMRRKFVGARRAALRGGAGSFEITAQVPHAAAARLPRRKLLPKYDLAIIGSGPGGYQTAIRASEWGLKTVVIEKDPFLGGTCLHVGCIPTKVLLHTAEIYDTFRRAKEFGIDAKDFKLNWDAVLARKTSVVDRHAKGIDFLFRKNKVDKIVGWGRWAGT